MKLIRQTHTWIRRACGCALLAAALAAAGLAQAVNYYVDLDWNGTQSGTTNAPYKTIKAAVDAANAVAATHNIYIAAGWYGDVANSGTEDYSAGGGSGGGINITKAINFYGGYAGWDGDGSDSSDFDWTAGARVPRATVVDLQGAASRAFYRGRIGWLGTPVIDGLTFCNANHTASGGVIATAAGSYNSGYTLNNCLFTNNVTTGVGGAVDLRVEALSQIRNCDFRQNRASNGGAVYCLFNYQHDYRVENCTFTNNTATAVAGALYIESSHTKWVINSRFYGNSAGSYGGGVFANSGRTEIDRCEFIGNSAANSTAGGAAVGGDAGHHTGSFTLINTLVRGNTGGYAVDMSGANVSGSYTVDMLHCTVVGNTGGGVRSRHHSGTTGRLRVRNSIIADNGAYGITRPELNDPDPILEYNNVTNNTLGGYFQCAAGVGSISNDPEFVDAAAGDFRLAKGSPCIDAGTDGGVATDLSGGFRPTRNGYDMGCYEESLVPRVRSLAPVAASDNVWLRVSLDYACGTTAGVYIYWGASDGGTEKSAWNTIFMGDAPPGEYEFNLVGLTPGSNYFFRCYASNVYDDVWADASRSFATYSDNTSDRLWLGRGGDALASTDANWFGGVAPSAENCIVLDSSSSNMTWNAGVGGLPNTVRGWNQTENYTGIVTFNTFAPGQGSFTNFTVSSDCRVLCGTWTHVANTAGSETQIHWLGVTVGGDFTLGPLATVNADGIGFSGYRGPGKPTPDGVQSGAGHGGFGAHLTYGRAGAIYGSVHNPTTLGSGGGRSDAPAARGGGAVVIAVAGDAVVNGTLTANGVFWGDTNGSGGSVNLVARTLSGTGVLRAHGGSGNYVDSGGGRVAVRLTQAGADFGAFTGSMTAYGGSRSYVSGAAGTVYRQTGDQAEGQGILVVDNGNRMPYLTGISTDMPAGVNLNDFASIIITNKGVLGVNAGDTLDFGLGLIDGAGAANAYVCLFSTTGVTFPDPYVITNYTLVGNTPIVASGNWIVASSGGMTHGENGYSSVETYRLDLTLVGNLTLDGEINVNRKGFRGGYGPGRPTHSHGGASYGGMGAYGYNNATLANVGAVYGSIVAPTNSGSGGGRTDGSTRAGGGAAILKITGNLEVNGAIRAESESEADTVGSGGTINITAGTISGSGPISANAAIFYQGAGGGRVAVRLTQPGAVFSSHTGLISAFGGNHSTALYDGAPGTVYRSAPGLTPTVTITNFAGASCATGVLTPLRNATDLKNVAVFVANGARLGVATNAYCGDLTVAGGGLLDLAGKTLTAQSAVLAGVKVPGGAHSAAALGSALVTDSSALATGLLVIRAGGTVVLLR